METSLNIHRACIDKIIKNYEKNEKWDIPAPVTSHEKFIKAFSSCIFTNEVQGKFTPKYVSKFSCPDCGGKAEERCHGIGEERPVLIKRALEKVWPDTSIPITITEIIIAFFEEHKYTKFTFKCKNCHKNEKKSM